MVKGPWHRVNYWRDKFMTEEGRWEPLFLYHIGDIESLLCSVFEK
jgi:hypothetical protein